MIRLLGLPALVLGLSASACAHVPLMSMAKLSSIDFATTDLSQLRAGIALPDSLAPVDGGVRMTILAETEDGMTIRRTFALEGEAVSSAADPAAGLGDTAKPGETVWVYRLPGRAAADLDEMRADLMAHKQETGNGGRMEIRIGAEACRTEPLTDAPLLMTTFLKTSETETFVPLARNVDLRSLAPAERLAGTLPSCV